MKQSKNGNIQISVQCHKSEQVVNDVRAYAKKRTQEELLKEKTK